MTGIRFGMAGLNQLPDGLLTDIGSFEEAYESSTLIFRDRFSPIAMWVQMASIRVPPSAAGEGSHARIGESIQLCASLLDDFGGRDEAPVVGVDLASARGLEAAVHESQRVYGFRQE
jgi:hypothetical protein